MKKLLALMMALMMVVSLSACGRNTTDEMYDGGAAETVEEEVSKYPMTVVDKYGNEVVIEAAPESIISMSPELTEILFGLGAGDKMIGRSSYCNFPEAAAEVQDFGSLFDLNIESIVAAQPDILFLSSMASEDLVTSLRDQELTVVTLDKDGTLEGTYAYIQQVGAMIDAEDQAETMVEGIKGQIDAVTEKVSGLEAPTVYYIVYAGDGYDSTATGDTFIHGMITTSGGDNIAKDGTDWSYSVESLVEQDPYMIFCGAHDGTKEKIAGLEGYKDLTAVTEGRVYEINPDIFSRQGPRIGEAVEVMAAFIHPEAFK